MEKIKMRDYIIHMMAEWGAASLLISCLKDGVKYVAYKAEVLLCDEFDANLPCVLQVIKDEPEIFKISENTNYLELVHPEKLNTYVEKWQLCSEVRNAIKEYVNATRQPLVYATIAVKQTVETERQMKADTKYIEWVCKLLKERDYFRNTDFHLAKNGKEVLNLLMLYNLFNATMRYCKKNLIYYSITDISESYVITYGNDDATDYIKITRFSNGNIMTYEARKWFAVRDAAYFPDIVLGVSSKALKRKEKMLRDIEEKFLQAKELGIPYYMVKRTLDEAYDYYDN